AVPSIARAAMIKDFFMEDSPCRRGSITRRAPLPGGALRTHQGRAVHVRTDASPCRALHRAAAGLSNRKLRCRDINNLYAYPVPAMPTAAKPAFMRVAGRQATIDAAPLQRRRPRRSTRPSGKALACRPRYRGGEIGASRPTAACWANRAMVRAMWLSGPCPQVAVKARTGTGSPCTSNRRNSPPASSSSTNTAAMTLVPMQSSVMRTTMDSDALPYMRGDCTPARVNISRTNRYGLLLDG